MLNTIARYWILIAIFAFPFLAHAGDKSQWVIQGQPFPRNLIIAVDLSGSMDYGQRAGIAINEAEKIAAQATDAGTIRFYAFNTSPTKDPQGWYAIPDEKKLKKSMDFLRSIEVGGNTSLKDAAIAILNENKQAEIGLLVITDGDPGSDAREDAKAILKANTTREFPACLGVLTIYPEIGSHEDKFGIILSKKGGGDYTRIVEDKGD